MQEIVLDKLNQVNIIKIAGILKDTENKLFDFIFVNLGALVPLWQKK
jgi:hypothetical protein